MSSSLDAAAVTVQAIFYTAHPLEWQQLCRDLGLTPVGDSTREWAEFAGDGIVAVHELDAGDPRCETAELNILVEQIDDAERALGDQGFAVERESLDDVGEILIVRTTSGVVVTVGEPARETGTAQAAEGSDANDDSPLAVMPIWYATDFDEPRRLLLALGLRPRIASDSGAWLDFTASGGGLVALHEGAPKMTLSLVNDGNQDAIASRLNDLGQSATIVDEAYNRTVLVDQPDGDQLWINGPYEDMYGYHRVD